MTGIYKITNPNGLIYIGKSKNIKVRWNYYRLYLAKTQPKLNASFLSYGYDKHIFQIIDECEFHELHNKEAYYINFYNSTTQLNCCRVYESDKVRQPKVKLTWGEYLKQQWLKIPKKQVVKKRDMSVGAMAQRKVDTIKRRKKKEYEYRMYRKSIKNQTHN